MARNKSFFYGLALVLTGLAANVGPLPAEAQGLGRTGDSKQPSLTLPLQCEPGRDCWLVNLPDADKTSKVRDYLCGKHTYNKHKGTDFAIRDYSVMRDGVAVVAAAPGRVVAVRDGELDGDVKLVGKASIKGRECGNAVVLDHGHGWETKYCHLRRNSIIVNKGDQVDRGEKLGLVGSSGFSAFPHIHLGVTKNRRVVDPFLGLQPRNLDLKPSCKLGENPLWHPAVLRKIRGPQTALYSAGFSVQAPNEIALRQGFYRRKTLPVRSPALVFWVDAFWVHAGDMLELRIIDPKGKVIHESKTQIQKLQARFFRFSGKKRATKWPPGVYIGEAVLTRPPTIKGPSGTTAGAGTDGLAATLETIKKTGERLTGPGVRKFKIRRKIALK